MNRIGIYGGSFNPIHNGHLIVAQSILDSLELDKIVFIPNGYNPFKYNQSLEERQNCLTMLKKATNNNSKFEVNPIEINQSGIKYTYDTLKTLKEDNPDTEFYFIIGSDLLEDLDKWFKFRELLEITNFVIVERPGFKNTLERIKRFNNKYNTNLELIKIPEIEISSTNIRNKVRLNKAINYLVPDSVIEFIKKNKLYKESEKYQKKIETFKNRLKKTLNPKRYKHSLSVMKTAIDLAYLYNEDITKAQIAGLLHDNAKAFKNTELLDIVKQRNLKIPDEFIENIQTLHAPVGAELAQIDFGIKDPDIINAIKYHTTGSDLMTKLDKIIFLADYIEPGRKQPGVEEVRKLSKVDLNLAVKKALENTISYLIKEGYQVNPSSVKALESIKKEIENE